VCMLFTQTFFLSNADMSLKNVEAFKMINIFQTFSDSMSVKSLSDIKLSNFRTDIHAISTNVLSSVTNSICF
jgi:hypothetical protein